MRAEVLIYLTGWCPYCDAAKRLLKKKDQPFESVDVDARAELREWLIEATGQRTVPQIFINGESVGGYSDLSALERAGKLDSMLATAPPEGRPALPR
jgi:glutaredoxin 3